MRTVTGQLTHVDGLKSSHYGNPRFEITPDNETTYRTEVDGSVGYEVMNHRIGSRVTLTLTRSGAVMGMVRS